MAFTSGLYKIESVDWEGSVSNFLHTYNSKIRLIQKSGLNTVK